MEDALETSSASCTHYPLKRNPSFWPARLIIKRLRNYQRQQHWPVQYKGVLSLPPLLALTASTAPHCQEGQVRRGDGMG